MNWLRAESILVVGRSEKKAQGIVHRIGGEVRPLESLLGQTIPTHIVVNATSVSSPEEAPELVALIASLQVPGCELVFDLNYGRSPNFWHDMARARGIPFRDGLTPLAHQAKRTFALWTGVQVAASEFLKAIEEA
jgi:shikimate dehydrogenase